MEQKIKRASNFTAKEETLLVSLVKQKYAKIIECKRTDTTCNKVKNEAWVNLTKEFNGLSGEQYRDVSALKIKYANLKKRSKERFAQQKQYMYGTGGGPSKIIDDTPIDSSFMEIIGTQMTGMSSKFGGDASEENKENEPLVLNINSPPEYIEETNMETNEELNVNWSSSENPIILVVNKDQDSTTREDSRLSASCSVESSNKTVNDKITDWSSYTPSQLRTPVCSSLRTKKTEAGSLRTKLGQWAAAKKNVTDVTAKHVSEEHCLKIKLMEAAYKEKEKQDKEKHELQLKHMKEIHEMEMRKHALEIDILILKKENFILQNQKL